MARYLVVEFDDDDAATQLMEKLHHASKRGAKYRVVALFVKPRRFCQCPDGRRTNFQADKSGHRGIRYGRKFGWWVCTGCGRPRKAGHQLINQLPGESLYPDTAGDGRDVIVTNLDIYSQDSKLVKRRKVKKKEK